MEVVLDQPITEAQWDALADPPGGRYEVLGGQLVVNSSSNARHNWLGEDLADLFRFALRDAGLDRPVTTDVEWRTVAADVVSEAPRGDVVVGATLDPVRYIHVETPLLVAEIWSDGTAASTVAAKRSYWKDRGLDHYWEITVGADEDAVDIAIWHLGSDRLPQRVSGDNTVVVSEPFAIEITPATIIGATQRIYDELAERVDELDERVDELASENEMLRRRLAEEHGDS